MWIIKIILLHVIEPWPDPAFDMKIIEPQIDVAFSIAANDVADQDKYFIIQI